MLAPEKFVQWMSANSQVDRRFGHVYRYHSRSDAHSIALSRFIVDDLLTVCAPLREQVESGELAYGTNVRFRWPSEKSKTLDLAIGPGSAPTPDPGQGAIGRLILSDIFIACEAKTVMTEHGKSQPRVYDELSSSHEIVHQGKPAALAAGITVVNIAETFVSPLRQSASTPLVVSRHKQPEAAARRVHHLRPSA